jgi:hypothetical protein
MNITPESRPLTEEEKRHITQLSDKLAEYFKSGGKLGDRYGFALWLIPFAQGAPVGAMLSNVPRPQVAEHVSAWLIYNGFAHAIPVPPSPTAN